MKLRCLWITAWFQAYQEPNCLPYVLQFIPRCPCILHYSDRLALSCWLPLLSCWNYPIKKGKIFTSSVVLEHHCSSSCKPAFKNSPLLNEQHSRRSSKLLKSCTFKYAYTWLNVFLIIIGGTYKIKIEFSNAFLYFPNCKVAEILRLDSHGYFSLFPVYYPGT